jgi:hypothetical protein
MDFSIHFKFFNTLGVPQKFSGHFKGAASQKVWKPLCVIIIWPLAVNPKIHQ